jgi:hypothetical protein
LSSISSQDHRIVDVPEGFILSTDFPHELSTEAINECLIALRKLEEKTHRKYDPKHEGEIPLLLSIRGSPTKPIQG